ncbi:MAG: prepilin-type N-terminal cleavage/methylation domain-containing protein [Thermodesulfobacteriota bacterium]
MNEKGFTLIELIVIIVILGILAVTAIPKYLDMTNEARTASVQGLAGGLAGANSIVHAACLLDPLCDVSIAGQTATVSGQAVTVDFGYPTADAAGILAAMDITLGNFSTTVVAGPPDNLVFHLTAAAGNNCEAVFTETNVAGTAATITTDTTVCNF